MSSDRMDEIRLDLEKASSVVATGRRLVAQGRTLDLTALEGKVAAACEAIAALPRDEARAVLPTLEALLAALDALESDLKSQYAAHLGSGSTTPDATRAAASYRRLLGPGGDADPGPDPDPDTD